MRIADKVVVIAGASSGIGRATALLLAKKGTFVILDARREDPADHAIVLNHIQHGLHLDGPPA